jgi:hypothetical protein
MRHTRSSKQCCWLGSSRYRGRCGHAVTNAYCDTNTYTHPNGYGYGNGYGHGQCYTNSHSNGYG